MEQRLIDANALKVSYCKQCLKETGNEHIEVKQTPYCAIACQDFDVIDKQPTVDAVPIEQIEAFIDWLERNGYTLLKKAIIKALHDYRTDGEGK